LNASVAVRLERLVHGTKLNYDERVRQVLRAIAADPSHDIPALARLVTLSDSRLSHLFKLETGCSLQTFLVDRRLEAAALALCQTENSVKEVSYTVGYRHPPSFVRAFRNRFGCSPSEYRAQQQILRMCS